MATYASSPTMDAYPASDDDSASEESSSSYKHARPGAPRRSTNSESESAPDVSDDAAIPDDAEWLPPAGDVRDSSRRRAGRPAATRASTRQNSDASVLTTIANETTTNMRSDEVNHAPGAEGVMGLQRGDNYHPCTTAASLHASDISDGHGDEDDAVGHAEAAVVVGRPPQQSNSRRRRRLLEGGDERDERLCAPAKVPHMMKQKIYNFGINNFSTCQAKAMHLMASDIFPCTHGWFADPRELERLAAETTDGLDVATMCPTCDSTMTPALGGRTAKATFGNSKVRVVHLSCDAANCNTSVKYKPGVPWTWHSARMTKRIVERDEHGNIVRDEHMKKKRMTGPCDCAIYRKEFISLVMQNDIGSLKKYRKRMSLLVDTLDTLTGEKKRRTRAKRSVQFIRWHADVEHEED